MNKQQINNLIINTSGNDDHYRDVHVITLQSHYENCITEQAVELGLTHFKGMNVCQRKLNKRIDECKEHVETDFSVRQYIDKPSDPSLPITVCLNVKDVDDRIYDKVISTLINVDYRVGKTEFGNPVNFSKPIHHSDDVLNNMELDRFV